MKKLTVLIAVLGMVTTILSIISSSCLGQNTPEQDSLILDLGNGYKMTSRFVHVETVPIAMIIVCNDSTVKKCGLVLQEKNHTLNLALMDTNRIIPTYYVPKSKFHVETSSTGMDTTSKVIFSIKFNSFPENFNLANQCRLYEDTNWLGVTTFVPEFDFKRKLLKIKTWADLSGYNIFDCEPDKNGNLLLTKTSIDFGRIIKTKVNFIYLYHETITEIKKIDPHRVWKKEKPRE